MTKLIVMGYCGIKIPGHTGTDFKHKKVFTPSKKLLSHKPKIENIRIVSREPKRSFISFGILKKTIGFLFIITLIIVISMLVYRIDDLSIHKDKITMHDIERINEQNIASEAKFLDDLYIGAASEYNNGKFTRAHEKLYALLLVDENNNPAEKLLIKVLVAKCEKFDIGCKQLEYYSKYLEKKYEHNN